MEYLATSADVLDAKADLIALGLNQNLDGLDKLEARLGGALRTWLSEQKFEGKAGQSKLLPSLGRLQASSILLLGTGKASREDLAEAAGFAGQTARKLGAKHLALDLGALDVDTLGLVAEFVAAGNYAWERYLGKSEHTAPIAQIDFHGASQADLDALRQRIHVRAKAQRLARDLVNLAPADLYPEKLAEIATEQAHGIEHLSIEVWDAARCKAEGLVGITAVGQGSARPPVLIHLTYRPPNPRDHIALVGKGVTFDAGGLSLKPSEGMQTMRCDMGGAATALAATLAIARQGLPLAVDTFLPSAENLVDGTSYKLGDVLSYRNGVQVEIHNTDAEGRLILADALLLASEVPGVSRIVDMATLTGAMIVALGEDFTGLFTDDDALAQELLDAGRGARELLWRMPLFAPYKAKLKTPFATIKNVGGRAGGSITAGLFLQHFVRDSARWAHLDIAGPAFFDSTHGIYAAGGSGQVVRTLTTWAEQLAK